MGRSHSYREELVYKWTAGGTGQVPRETRVKMDCRVFEWVWFLKEALREGTLIVSLLLCFLPALTIIQQSHTFYWWWLSQAGIGSPHLSCSVHWTGGKLSPWRCWSFEMLLCTQFLCQTYCRSEACEALSASVMRKVFFASPTGQPVKSEVGLW